MKQDNRSPRSVWLLLGVAILIPALKVGIIDRIDTPLRRPNLVDGQLVNVDVPTQITFGDEFLLLGHDALPEAVASGARYEVRTYWRASQPGGPNYGVTVHVVDAEGRRWDDIDVRPPRWHRTPPPVGEWPPDKYALIALSIPLKPGTPPGTYKLELVAFDRATLAPLTAHDAAGRALGPQLPIGQIVVTRPDQPPCLEALEIERRLDESFGPLTLLDAHPDRAEAAPGDSVLLTTLWHAEENPVDDLNLRVNLVAADGLTVVEYVLPATAAWHPTSGWVAGDVWRGQQMLRLPARLESGTYRWTLQLCQEAIESCWPPDAGMDLDSIEIVAPDRQWTVPPLDVTTDSVLGGMVTLLGANIAPEPAQLRPGDTLTVTLVWRAEQGIEQSYRVFVHLLGADGMPVAQADGEPANWTRPTTGWIPGEIVTDMHTLVIPEDITEEECILQAGMYTLAHGRLSTQDGDAVELAAFTILPGRD
jgi:hypothetical protein